ncbi:radical SAM protein [Vibrio europaeus]|uniref:radical SAM protein n=1 Tax=Vibrio europaeus TaxID=300876 RepID=UPI00233F558A|nr:radical SAM protein [Vibrio europaeus]MDC5807916.1 radical SAM protein [Vibrio europaeus]MDC5825418.1 radical SAM protein [Vibrio europaeus]MDC5832706.1 radical SAM protein [Vibrio europaeus]MDC5835617.1 radical SAM protein [Vibrio europaeus]
MKKLYLAHNTCLNSSYDLNVLEAGLVQKGYELVLQPEDADEVIYSGCSVRGKWVEDAISQINEVVRRAPNAEICITGCIANTSMDKVRKGTSAKNLSFGAMPQILRDKAELRFTDVDDTHVQDYNVEHKSDSQVGLQNLRLRVGEEKASIVASLQEIDRTYQCSSEMQYRRTTKGFVFYNEQDPFERITVTRSCPYKCTFCSIPKGRGEFTSVALSSVLSKARKAIEQGKYHIVLLGDEVGNYRCPEGGTDFPTLIENILGLSPKVELSIRYIEPKPFQKYYNNIMSWSEEGRIRLLYLSVQSGSYNVLRKMKRGYKLDRLKRQLSHIRCSTPVVLYGNWLIGFPSESEKDFDETVSLVKSLNFHINVVIPFSAREGTPAYTMDEHLPPEIIDARVKHLTEVVAEMKCNDMRDSLVSVEASVSDNIIERIRSAERSQYANDQEASEPTRVMANLIEVKIL